MVRWPSSGSLAFALAQASVVCCLVVCTLCLGGAPHWALWPLVVFSALGLGFTAVASMRFRQPLRIRGLAWVIAAVCAVCLVQLIPLPARILDVLSPAAAELREFALVPLGFSPAGALSQDPPATWRELAKHLGYLALYVSTAQLLRLRSRRLWPLVLVASAGILVAIIGLGHLLAGGHSLFGLYEFTASSPVLTPFGNPNHLAAFLTIAASCAMGVALEKRKRSKSWPWALGYLVIGTVLILSLSRSGIVFFVVSQALLAALVWKWREPEAASRARAAPIFWVLVGVLLVGCAGAYLALDSLEGEWKSVSSVEEVRSSKVRLWPMFWNAARAFPLTGMGRGAFEAAFTRYQVEGTAATYTHPENLILQWTAECGLAVTLILAGAAIFLLYRAIRSGRKDIASCVVIAALFGLVLHDLFDFSLELPATALAVVILLPLLGGSRESGDAEGTRSTPSVGRHAGSKVALAAAAAILAAGCVATWKGSSTLAGDEQTLSDWVRSGMSPDEVTKRALPLIERHPSDYLLYGILASAWSTAADPRQALAFANRALFLRPIDPDAHLSAGRALLRMGKRSQAMLEYRLGAEAAGSRVFAESVAQARSVEELIALTPDDPDQMIVVANRAWSIGKRDLAMGLLSHGRQRFEGDARAARLWTVAVRYSLMEGDPAGALELAKSAVKLAPDNPDCILAEAQALSAAGQRDAAIQTLQEGIQKHRGEFELSLALAENLHAAGRVSEARAQLHRVEPLSQTARDRGRLFAMLGRFYRAEGKLNKALEQFESSARLQPELAEYRFAMAQILEQLHRPGEAIRLVREGVQLQKRESEENRAWLERLLRQQAEVEKLRRQPDWTMEPGPGSSEEVEGL
ncbi:MAG: O-antigen ligase family protein [Myxococcaceae bacterium]|nr:O-antigen ligase family protein [Myxococcaceae bacterium]